MTTFLSVTSCVRILPLVVAFADSAATETVANKVALPSPATLQATGATPQPQAETQPKRSFGLIDPYGATQDDINDRIWVDAEQVAQDP